MRRALTRVLPLILATSAVASCDSSTGPDGSVERLVLTEIAGEPVAYPRPIAEIDQWLLGDTLELLGDGAGMQHIWWRQGVDGTPNHDMYSFSWRLEQGRLRIDFPCHIGQLLSCVAPPHIIGRLSGDALEVVGGAFYPEGARFRRVGGAAE